MSWSYRIAGRAGKLAEIIADKFATTQSCPKGSAEEAAKNALGVVAASLCASHVDPNAVVIIEANGSAWNEGDKARSQSVSFKLETRADFIE